MSMKKLNELIDELNGKIVVKDYAVENINASTVRVVRPDKLTEPNQFVYKNGLPVKEGIAYHIHYTNDLEEYYMTGLNHEEKSMLIYPKKPMTNFSIYNNVNKQPKLTLKPFTLNPTEYDYKRRFIDRCFAKKTNEVQSPIFEIKKEQNGSSPLYDYVSLRWFIRGNKRRIGILNANQIKRASTILPSIRIYLSPYQYYRQDESEETKEDLLNKLGIQSVSSQSPGSQTTTGGTTSTTGTGYSPPSSGGGGGGSGGSGGGGGGY